MTQLAATRPVKQERCDMCQLPFDEFALFGHAQLALG
jgi:hypothetical protein